MIHKRILIASVLKPVNDTRSYEKMGISLANEGYEVHLCGQSVEKIESTIENIHFHSLFQFRRKSIKRYFTFWVFLSFLFKLKPKQIIVNTHELLLPTLVYHWITKISFYYDIRENYYLNILHTKAFPSFVKLPIAYYVRLLEWFTAPWVRYFILAEACYAQELPFLKKRKYVIVENKYPDHLYPIDGFTKDCFFQNDAHTIQFVYTGTITIDYGIFSAVNLIKKLSITHPNVRLLIIGHCPSETTWKQLIEETQDIEYISIIGGKTHVPHSKILKAIHNAHYLLAPYHITDNIINRIPTRFYEGIAFKTPIIYRSHPFWATFLDQYQAGYATDFENIDIDFLEKLLQANFYIDQKDNNAIYWSSIRPIFLSIFKY